MADFQCRICGSDQLKPWPYAAHYVHKPQGVLVYKCLVCGTVSSPDSGYDYNSAYYEKYENFQPNTPDYAKQTELFTRRAVYLSKQVGGGRILDIGCARGHFLDLAAKEGFVTFGVEMSADAAEKAREKGHRVVHTMAESLPFSTNAFNAIHMNHVLEHVAAPLEALREIRRILRPDGIAIIEVPTELEPLAVRLKLLAARMKIASLEQVTYNPHIVYFDRRSLSDAVTRAGFRILSQRTRFGGDIIPSVATVPAMLARVYNLAAGIGDVVEVTASPK